MVCFDFEIAHFFAKLGQVRFQLDSPVRARDLAIGEIGFESIDGALDFAEFRTPLVRGFAGANAFVGNEGDDAGGGVGPAAGCVCR